VTGKFVRTTDETHLKKLGVWQTSLTRPQLERAIQETERFYRSRDLDHWAGAVREFYNRAYRTAR
jgi:hypothetical protein